MLKQIFPAVVTVVILLTAPTSMHAQTLNLSEAVARMNSIIAEMEKLRSEFSALAAVVGKPTTPAPEVLGAQAGPVFTQSLAYGQTNEDIKRIQKLLATDTEVYPYGVASGFFGPKTEEAVRNFQARFGLDPVGAVGPATTALLELFMRAYPDGNYPAGVLKQKPQPQGVSVPTPPTTSTNTPPAFSGTNPAKSIKVNFSDGESLIVIHYSNGNRNGLVADTTDKEKVITYIASRTVLTDAMIRQVIDFTGRSDEKTKSSGGEIKKIVVDINDGESDIAVKYQDRSEVEFTVDEYKEKYVIKAIAKKLKVDEDDVANVIEFDYGKVSHILIRIDDDDSLARVYYTSGVERRVRLNETDEDDIIEALAEEIDEDEDDVEDWADFL